VRYSIGPAAAVGLMGLLIAWHLLHREAPWRRSEPVSPQFQTHPEGEEWEPYSEERLRAALDEGKVVLVHFIAPWRRESAENRMTLCRSTFLREGVARGQLTLLLADHSDKSPAVELALRRLDRRAPPVVAVYPPDGAPPIVLDGRVSDAAVAECIQSALP